MSNIQRYCVYCGTKFREKAKFCEGCGKEPLSKENINEKSIEEIKQEFKKELLLGWKFTVVVLVLVVCIFSIIIIGLLMGII